MSLLSASIAIAPVLQLTTTDATNYIDVGAPSQYDLQIDDLTYKADVINYRGNDIVADLSSSSSAFAGFTFRNDFGVSFGTARGFSLIRIKVTRVTGSASPDLAHPVSIVLTGPGLPAFTVDVVAPQEFVFIQPIGSLADLNATTSHIAATVPVENQGILALHIQLHAWKDA